jgi:hypothetical protein
MARHWTDGKLVATVVFGGDEGKYKLAGFVMELFSRFVVAVVVAILATARRHTSAMTEMTDGSLANQFGRRAIKKVAALVKKIGSESKKVCYACLEFGSEKQGGWHGR